MAVAAAVGATGFATAPYELRRGPAANLRWSRAEPPAETAIEVRDFIEPAGGGDLADFQPVVARVRQHRPRALEPELDHPIGEACARFVQQVLNVARGHADLAGQGLRRECRVGKARGLVITARFPHRPQEQRRDCDREPERDIRHHPGEGADQKTNA